MRFNTITFLVFFACVMALHYLPTSWRTKKTQLLIASYLFYAAWNPPFVLLLWFSTLADWILAKRIQTSVSTSSRRLYLALSLVANLGMLGFFRYTTFAVDNTVALLDLFGIPVQLAAPDIVLPIGISFYTFQTLSYTIDVYRRQAKPWTSFLDYALYVTFFPQLVAGPIVRAFEFLPQCLEPRRATGRELSWGLMLLTVGLFEKVVVADTLLGPIADAVYQPQVVPSTLMAWVGTLAFAGQIFGDFAGYSTCAIGVAMCLGFSLPNNFRFPYASTGFSDFWRRWHVSLSTWLRDYVYISFGGNQIGELRTYINLMLTMLLGGLWHGASWNFVLWGALHGVYLVVERVLRGVLPDRKARVSRFVNPVLALLTFALVCLTWVFFRAKTLGQSVGIVAAMIGFPSTHSGLAPVEPLGVMVTFVVVGIMLVVHYALRETSLENAAARIPWWLRSVALGLMLTALLIATGEDRDFIYFQF